MKNIVKQNALLEVGVEEIPARFMSGALDQLKNFLEQGFERLALAHGGVTVYGTPRRLVAFVAQVAPRSQDRKEIVVGPPPKAAKDAAGAWTPAALGFAKAQNFSVDKLELQNTPKGERYVAQHLIKGQKTESLLKELFPSVIAALTFPKTMIWSTPDVRFARPIRWILASYGNAVIRFKIAGLSSDRTTYGLLSLGGQKISVSKPEKYKSILQGRCILVDQDERKKQIRSQLEAVAKRLKVTALVSEAHLEEVVYLTEYPVSIVGHFPEAYLALPREILISVLKKHQKFFPLESSKGQLLNAFVGVRNGPSESQEQVREGYERVVNARFADAQFFYEKDAALSFDDLVQKLSGVGFHEKLGSMLDKTIRVRELVKRLAQIVTVSDDVRRHADRAAQLSKADLLTQMVSEFPELQGIAGRFYTNGKESDAVAQALEEHYWPLTADGALPQSDEAALVAVADKMDTLAANFSVGLIPSGSADPYGLRRAAAGVARILLERQWPVSLKAVIDLAFQGLKNAPPASVTELNEFFRQRLITLFTQQGYRADELDAVLGNGTESLALVASKLQGLKSVRGRPELASLSAASKRIRNLLTQAHSQKIVVSSAAVSSDKLPDAADRALFSALSDFEPRLKQAASNKDYAGALVILASLREPIDAFFSGAMVMVEDVSVREQRLGLLQRVNDAFSPIVDLSKLEP